MADGGSDAGEEAARFDGMFAGVSLQSLLLEPTRHLHPIDDYPHLCLPPSILPQPPPLSFPNTITDDQVEDSYAIGSSFALKTPKPEPPEEPIADSPEHEFQDEPSLLPYLDCFQFQPTLLPSESDPLAEVAGKHLPEQELPITITTTTQTPGPASRIRRSSNREANLEKQRERRRSISEKVSCLRKLMPWHRKMDRATLLEEARKYILFLEAQVSSLLSMPAYVDDPPPLPLPPLPHYYQQPMPLGLNQAQNNSWDGDAIIGSGYGSVLEEMTRQQTLQMLVNSPVAQTVLYSHGQCVVSMEQLEMPETAIMAMVQQQQQQQLQQSMTATTPMLESSSWASNFYSETD